MLAYKLPRFVYDVTDWVMNGGYLHVDSDSDALLLPIIYGYCHPKNENSNFESLWMDFMLECHWHINTLLLDP